MTQNQITALAREYGEYVANRLDHDMCSDPELRHKLVAKGNSEFAQHVLEWLLRRFCLVEKSKIQKEYDEAKIFCENLDPCGGNYTWCESKIRLLESLFPEIAKEVEL